MWCWLLIVFFAVLCFCVCFVVLCVFIVCCLLSVGCCLLCVGGTGALWCVLVVLFVVYRVLFVLVWWCCLCVFFVLSVRENRPLKKNTTRGGHSTLKKPTRVKQKQSGKSGDTQIQVEDREQNGCHHDSGGVVHERRWNEQVHGRAKGERKTETIAGRIQRSRSASQRHLLREWFSQRCAGVEVTGSGLENISCLWAVPSYTVQTKLRFAPLS